MASDVFRKVGDVSNAQSVRDTWKAEIKKCQSLVSDNIENDKRELMEWLLAKQSYEQTDILAMRSIRKSCNFVG